MTTRAIEAMVSLFIVALIPSIGVSEVISGQGSDFQDGTTNGWISGPADPDLPTHVPSGGPLGANDQYLQIESFGGFGPGSKLAAFNESPWAGDYAAAGVSAISADLKNFGNQSLDIRLMLEHGNPNGAGRTRFISSESFFLSANGDWQSATFGLSSDDLTWVEGSHDLDMVLGDVAKLWIFHNSGRSFPGPNRAARLGVDNLTAVPEPSTVWLCGFAALMLFGYRKRKK